MRIVSQKISSSSIIRSEYFISLYRDIFFHKKAKAKAKTKCKTPLFHLDYDPLSFRKLMKTSENTTKDHSKIFTEKKIIHNRK